MCKKDDMPLHQKSNFFIGSKREGLSSYTVDLQRKS